MTVGENIRRERIKQGLTQKQLGEKCGMADSAIRRYESDRGNPTIGTLKRIAFALRIQPWDLLPNELLDEWGITEEMKQEAAIIPFLDIITDHLRKLNLDGLLEAARRVEELTEIPKYKKEPPQD